MAVSEIARYRLYEWFGTHMGADLAPTMIESLPPVNWTDVATKDDVERHGIALRSDMAELRGELRGEIAELRGELRGEMTELRGELQGEMTELRGEMTELRGDMAGLRGELRGEMGAMESRLTAQSSQNLRVLFFGMVGSNATLVGLVFAAVRLAEG